MSETFKMKISKIKCDIITKKSVKIYALIDSRNLKVMYVGKTESSLEKRLWQHLNHTNGSSKKVKWINDCISNNVDVLIKTLEEVPLYKSEEAEIKWIKYYAVNSVLNSNKGGGGSFSNKNYNSLFKFRIFMENNYSKNTINSYLTAVKSMLEFYKDIRRPIEINSDMISEYLDTLPLNTRRVTLSAIKLFYLNIINQPKKVNGINYLCKT